MKIEVYPENGKCPTKWTKTELRNAITISELQKVIIKKNLLKNIKKP